MAFTQAIDDTTPTGSDDASIADDQIRALKRDLIERFSSFFDDVDSDPFFIKADKQIVDDGNNFYIAPNQGVRVVQTRTIDTFVFLAQSAPDRIILGYAGGGANGWAWVCMPNVNAAQVPAGNASLAGAFIVENDGGGSFLFYSSTGNRYRVTGTLVP